MQSLLEKQREFASHLTRAASSEGVAVYRSNVYGNWTTALAAAYPIVRRIVGEPFFDAMAREYAHTYPSRSGDLNDFGQQLAEFLETFTPAQDLPYLRDVASLEWLAHRAYFAAKAPSCDVSRLRDLPPACWSDLRVALVPACAVLRSAWPLARIWAVHQDDYEGEIDVDLGSGPDRLLVHRPRWRVQVRALGAGDYDFLEAARRGERLGDALEAGANDAAFDASSALARWINEGVLLL